VNPETRAFLDSVRDAEDPSAEDEQRVLSAVRATVALGGVGVGGVATWKWLKLFTACGVPGLKAGPVVLCLMATAGVSDSPLPNSAGATHVRATRSARHAAGAPPEVRRSAPVASVSSVQPALEPAPARRVVPPASPAPARVVRAGGEEPPPSLRGELAVLADVQASIRQGDANAALSRLDEQAAAERPLLAERALLRILALCALGKTAEARAAAADFERNHPGSVQGPAVERSCAGTKTSPDP
jgi:hypothetical protein